MILKKVKLRDFISHADTEIEFPLGVTVLVGPNGAGKTSIVDGVVFALFGDKVRGEKVEDMIRRGASSANVELTFEVDKEYTVHWIRKKRGVEAVLSRSDAGVIADTKEAVLEEVSRILKMDKKTAMNSIFIRQGEIASLIDADPKDRKKLLGRLIGLDTLEEVWEKMQKVVSHFEEIRNGLETKVKEVEKEVEVRGEQRDKLSEGIKELTAKIKDLEQELTAVAEELEAARGELEKWNEKKKKHDEFAIELAQVVEGIKTTAREVERLEDELRQAEKAKKRVEELEPEIKKIPFLEEYVEKSSKLEEVKKEKEQLNKDLGRIFDVRGEIKETTDLCRDYSKEFEEEIEVEAKELSEIEKFVTRTSTKVGTAIERIEEKEQEIEKLLSKALEVLPEPTIEARNARLRELKERRDKIEEEISGLNNKRGGIKRRMKDLKDASKMLGEADTCPVCKTKLTPEHRERVKGEVQGETGLLNRKLEEVKEELKKQELEKKEVEKEIDRVSKIDVERIEVLRKEVAERREEVARHYQELHAIMQLIDDLENEIEAEVSAIDVKIGEIERILNGLVEKIGYKPEDPEKELKELRKMNEEYSSLKAIADKCEGIKQRLDGGLERLRELESKRKRIQKEIAELEYDEEKHGEERKRYEGLLREFERKNAELNEKKEVLEKKQIDLKETERKIAELRGDLKKLNEKLETIVRFIGKLNNIRRAFSRDGVQKLLRQKVAPLMSEFAGKYIERFNLDVTDITVSEDFDISTIKEGGEISIKSISGGEKVAVAIALRLAIAKVLAGRISTIVMDEPTTHLDEERRRELVEIMRSFFREGAVMPQMIIVTHHRELEEIADTVYQVEKVDGISRVTEVY